MLAAELPNARLVIAHSILELRVHPARLTGKIATFVDQCWDAADAASASATGVA